MAYISPQAMQPGQHSTGHKSFIILPYHRACEYGRLHAYIKDRSRDVLLQVGMVLNLGIGFRLSRPHLVHVLNKLWHTSGWMAGDGGGLTLEPFKPCEMNLNEDQSKTEVMTTCIRAAQIILCIQSYHDNSSFKFKTTSSCTNNHNSFPRIITVQVKMA